MLRFVIRRLLLAVLTLIAISITTFVVFFLGPANPVTSMCGQRACSEAQQATIKANLGLDEAVAVQYLNYMKGIFVGRSVGEGESAFECPAPCLGISFRTREPVLDILMRGLPVTASIVLGAAVVYLTVGIGTGMVAAIRRGSALDKLSVGTSLTFASMQIYFLGLVLLYFLVYQWKILPNPKYVSPFEDVGAWILGMMLPWLTLGLINSAVYSRLSRAQMIETLSEDFIRTARSKGLGNAGVNLRHAFRAAVTPMVTIAGLDVGLQLGGAVITETTFSLNGMGRTAVQAVVLLNLPVVAATVLLAAVFVVAANIIVDLLYVVIDPRVRLS
jgi:peptide/nickel transport system permease protein